jgi:hypothetical protein
MILLTGTAHILRIVTGSGGIDVRVRADWLENDAGTITPGSQNTASITTATTTTIVPAPASGKQRNVGSVNITNNHATAATQVTVEHYDGTTAIPLMGVTLLPGEDLDLSETGSWRHTAAPNGAPYLHDSTEVEPNVGPTGTIAETIPRWWCIEEDRAILLTGKTWYQGIWLKKGQVITNISMSSATTAAGTPTNWSFGIYRPNRYSHNNQTFQRVATTADQGTAAWAANTMKTLALTAPYTVPGSGQYFIAVIVVATTMPTLKCGLIRLITSLVYVQQPIAFDDSGGFTILPDFGRISQANQTSTLYAAVS